MKIRAIFVLLIILSGVLQPNLGAETAGTWIDVPFVAQLGDGCGSASISMVVRYWENRRGQAASLTADPEKIQAALFSPAAGGIPASMMRKYFQDIGYRAFAFQGQWDDLKHHLDKGRPLIVGLRESWGPGPLHYVVIVGIDSERGYVFMNDPAQQKMLRISREGLESEWRSTQNWTLLAVPRVED